MHILVATDGTLDPGTIADAVARWHSEGDEVSVFTAMNVPTDFLNHLGDPGIKEAAHVALEAGQGIGDRAAEQLKVPVASPAAEPTSPTAAPMLRALAATAAERTKPVVAALKERGVAATATWATTDNRTAREVIKQLKQHNSGLVVIGTTGQGKFEGLLGSTGTKLVRHSPASVLVIRS